MANIVVLPFLIPISSISVTPLIKTLQERATLPQRVTATKIMTLLLVVEVEAEAVEVDVDVVMAEAEAASPITASKLLVVWSIS